MVKVKRLNPQGSPARRFALYEASEAAHLISTDRSRACT
jgi:hypothetical protein